MLPRQAVMRVLLVTFGSDGDTRPMLALARGLRAAGHVVRLLADPSGAGLAQAEGVDFTALDGDLRAAMQSGADGVGQAMRSGRLDLRDLGRIVRQQTGRWLEQIDAAAADADVVLGTSVAVYHALSVGQTRGIVRIAAGFQPYLPTRQWPSTLTGVTGLPARLNRPFTAAVNHALWLSMKRPLNTARARLGQPRLRRMWPHYPALGAWSPTLVPTPPDWDGHRRGADLTVTGDWPLRTDGWRPPTELADFLAAGEPPLYLGFGSMTGFGDEDALVGALLRAADGRRVLLASGWAGLGDRDDLAGSQLPDGVLRIGVVPHDWLFPRCAAVVHHCGAGTSHSAARAGVPTVPVPIVADQPFWAGRLRALGVATEPVDRHRIDEGVLRAAVEAATGSELRARAGEVAARLAGEDGVAVAVATVERLVGEGSG